MHDTELTTWFLSWMIVWRKIIYRYIFMCIYVRVGPNIAFPSFTGHQISRFFLTYIRFLILPLSCRIIRFLLSRNNQKIERQSYIFGLKYLSSLNQYFLSRFYFLVKKLSVGKTGYPVFKMSNYPDPGQL